MTIKVALLVIIPLLVLVSGCSRNPLLPQESWPTVATAPELPESRRNGAIYQEQRSFMPLFEDFRPRRVGDIITIALNEQVSASKNASSNANRSGSGSLALDDLPNGMSGLAKLGFDVAGETDFEGGGGSRANNTFSGTITVSVQEVMANGNLRVAGEKQIAINNGTEYIRFSGVVNPRTIAGQNTVPSTQVADARMQYVGDGYVSEAQRMGWLQRFFLNVAPY